MAVAQEIIERLKREKTVHSTEELDHLGWARYAEIRDWLEARCHGEYVMIEVDSGEYGEDDVSLILEWPMRSPPLRLVEERG